MTSPFIYGDFNGLIEVDTYSLDSEGTRSDVRRLGISLAAGLAVTLYDYDGFESGEPAWILADASIVELPNRELAAKVDPRSFRWEPRDEGEKAPSNKALNATVGRGRPPAR